MLLIVVTFSKEFWARAFQGSTFIWKVRNSFQKATEFCGKVKRGTLRNISNSKHKSQAGRTPAHWGDAWLALGHPHPEDNIEEF